ncbi:uncharacterized protein A1O9_05240 [Exophiala aquamarina CBS 119918]|uniref:DUF1993 domain-containing protein n=1 Tax=Exophiala aquamarina CBS 119918 TaxID=1182545 RepID=A0A072PDG9_9EURO|nr:uncharacterized protein A1O9_05240 [Exophiala aquamarina CBS 119918]KEF57323.1 hypothetical protein A1O9_05240 [Exophiala aquamarina CBS 119918]
MASITLYDTAVVPMTRTLKNLSKILKKGEAFANEKGMPHSDLLEARLISDMHPLIFQVQTASNTAKFLAVRVAGVENVSFADDEKTFDDLQSRLAKTIEFLDAIKRDQFDGREKHEFVFRDMNFTGLSYVNGFALPNFYFHAVNTYSILRMKGVPIGKWDWLGTS